MTKLNEKKCVPCSVGAIPLNKEEITDFLKDLEEGWELKEDKFIEKTYKFKNFKEALKFTNQVGEIAEEEGHHPDIFLSWGKVVIKLWTHKIEGLHENDFIMASKFDKMKTRYE